MRILVALASFAAGVACGSPGTFTCEDDAQCSLAGAAGMCQPSGSCSFPDDDCPSGQRFGEHAAVGLAGVCVPTSEDGSGGPADDDGVISATGTAGGGSSDGGPISMSDADGTSDTGPIAVDDSGTDAGSSTGGEPLDPDLILWLTFDDPDAPFSDSSLYARDVGCDAALDACPGVAAVGASAPAIELDGVDDHLEVAHDPALETDLGLTVSARVRNDALSDLLIHTVIARPYGVASENSWEVFFRDENADGTNDVVFEIADAAGQLQVVAPAPVAKGEWTRISAVWTGDAVSLWFDGVLQAEAASTGMLLDDNAVFVGADLDALTVRNYFQGALDDVRIYRRALSDAELASLP